MSPAGLVPVALLVSLLSGCGMPGPAGAGPLYREAVATFDDPVKAFETHLSGSIGELRPGNRDRIDLVHRPDMGAARGCLDLAWRMEGDAGSDESTGIWLSLRGPLASTHVVLDLSAWDSLLLKVRGRASLVDGPLPGQPGCTMRVEVRDDRRSGERAAFRYVRVEPAEAWSTVTLSADIGDGNAWRFTSRPLDPRRAKELRFVIEKRFNRPRGRLLLDDIELARRATPRDCGAQDDDTFLDEVARATFRFFWDYAHPTLGFIPDRSTWHDLHHPPGIGFQLAAMCIGAERGYITRGQAADRVRLVLSSLLNLPRGPGRTGISGYRGHLYHFLDENGLRKGEPELSNIDMALLSCGALTCRGYFNRDGENDIRDMAKRLFAQVDWRMTFCDNGQFSHGWKPELPGGLLDLKWDCYTDEPYLICLLAIAGNVGKKRQRRVPVECMWRWDRVQVKAPHGSEFIASISGSMFCHTFASLWLGPEALNRPDLHPTRPVNWWRNTRDYARANHEYCRAHPELYGEFGWGLTACEGRLGDFTIYRSYGSPPVFGLRGPGDYYQLDTPQPTWWRFPGKKKPDLVHDNSVLVVYGAAGAIGFLPEEAIRALRYYRRHTDLWRSADCGFGDSYAPSTGYTNHAVFAIDAGPMLIAIDNYRALTKGRKGAVWRGFVANPEIRHALDAIYGAGGRR